MILQNLPSGSNDRLVKAQLGNLGEICAGLVDIDDRCLKYEGNSELGVRISECL